MKTLHLTYLFLGLLCIVLSLLGCAGQEMPAGGPVDVTTPQIVAVYPDSNARNFADTKMRFEFDRYVDERSVEESIFISPPIDELEFDWSGREVNISFTQQLRSNTTYVVNIGTDVRDRSRNLKTMAESYTLAFSTGPDIDWGAMRGNIIPAKDGDPLSGVMIFAYRLNKINPDTLSPITSKPDFMTQTGKNGDFFLSHLPFGEYRIFAIRDEYRNLIYDREVDEYGVPSSMIKISADDSLRTDILMKLSKEDTTGPRLMKVTSVDRNHLVAEFSESLHPASLVHTPFMVVDTMDQRPLELMSINLSPSNASSCIIITGSQDSTKVYRLSVTHATDSAGNSINALARSLHFRGSSKTDSAGARLVAASIKDSAQTIDLQPSFTLTFSDALALTASLDWVDILDQNRKSIPAEKKKLSDYMISISPTPELISRTWYVLRADLQNLRDWSGRAVRDSVKQWRFETLDLEEMSTVEGNVTDGNAIDTAGRLYVSANSITSKPHVNYTVSADVSGKFIFPRLVEGRYVFQAFRDRNRNGKYDPGRPFPFIFSERLSPFSDTLKVRARWPLEGVHIPMK